MSIFCGGVELLALVEGTDDYVHSKRNTLLGLEPAVVHPYELAHASGHFATDGDVQHLSIPIRRQATHSDATWYELYTDGAAAQLTIPNNTAWHFNARIIGSTSGMTKTQTYGIVGCIENDAGTTTLMASVVTTVYEDDANFDARATADDANDALALEVQDSAGSGDTLRWFAYVRISQITYA